MPSNKSKLRNTGQSIMFGAYKVLEDKNPAIKDLYDTNVDFINDVRDTLRGLRKGQVRLIDALSKVSPGLGQTANLVGSGIKNLGADAKYWTKTGKIPGMDDSEVNRGKDLGGENISMEGDEFDLGEDDFNFDELDAALKGDDASSIKDTVSLKTSAAEIAATNKTTESVLGLGRTVGKGFSGVGTAIGKQTNLLTGALAANSKVSAQLSANMIAAQTRMTNQLSATLTMVNENITNLVTFHHGAMQQHFSTSAQFYNDTVTELRKLNETISLMTGGGEKKQRDEYVTDFDKVFNGGGALNLREYMKVIGSNLEKTEVGSMISQFINNPEALAEIARNPMAFFVQTGLGTLIPKVLEKSMAQFNDSLSAFFPALMSKFNEMANSDNPILQTIGTLLGVESPGGSPRLGDYEKGAVPFDGITRKAIVDVIPSYLSKMLAAMTGTQERIFDYNEGIFKTMNQIRQDFETREYMERKQALGGGQKVLDEIVEEIAFENERQRETFKEAVDAFKTALTKKDFTNFNSEADIAEIANLMGNFDMLDEDGNPIGSTNDLAQFLAAQIRNRTSRSQQMRMASAKARKGSISQRNYKAMENAGDVSLFHLNNHFTDEDLADEMPFTGSFAGGGSPGFFKRILTRGNNKQALAYDQNGNPIIVGKGETIVPATGSTINITGKAKGEAAFAYSLMNNAYGNLNKKFDRLIDIQQSMLSRQPKGPKIARKMSVDDYYDSLDQKYYEQEEAYLRSGDQEGLKKLRADRERQQKEEEKTYFDNMDKGMVTFEEIMQNSDMALRTHNDWRREQMEKMGQSVEKNEFDKYMERYLKEDGDRQKEFSFRKWIEKPSSILADTINVIDDTLYRVLFGAKPEEDSLIEVLVHNFQGLFTSVKNWLVNDIFTPVKKFLFGEDFFATKFYKMLTGAGEFATGEKDENGNYKGGFASDLANEFEDTGKGLKHLFTGSGYTDSKGNKVASSSDSVFGAMNDTFSQAGRILKNYTFGENKGGKSSSATSGWGRQDGFVMDDLVMSDDFANELTGVDFTPSSVAGHKSKGGWAQKTGYYNLTKGEFVVPRYLAKRVPRLMAALRGESVSESDAADLAGSTIEENAVGGLNQSIQNLTESIDRVSGEKVLSGALLPKEMKEELIAEQAASAAEYMETNQKPFIDLFTEKVMGSVGSFAAMLSGSSNYEQAAVQAAYLKTMREKAPSVIANSIVGTAGLLAAKWAGLGLLGTMISPMGAAALATTLSIAHSSERFKSYLYGDLDEQTGKRMGGLIPDTVKDFFRENKTGMVGGALMGMIGGITGITPIGIATGLLSHLPIIGGAVSAGAGALGFLPSLALGITGPVLMGAAVGTAVRSQKFQQFMYGIENADGDKIGGLMNSEFVTTAKRLMPDTLVGAALGHVAFGGLGAMVSGIPGLGLLGSMALTPYMGAIAGGALGMAMASNKFNEWMFGKQDENGVYTQGGMWHVAQNFFTHEIFKPIGAFAHRNMLRFEDFIVEDILLPASKVLAPLEVLALRTFDTVKDFVNALFTDTKSLIMKILRPAITVMEKVVTTTAKTLSAVGNTVFDLVTGLAGMLISLPFKMLGAGGKTLEFLERRTGDSYIDILDEANERYKERKSSYKERKKERWEEFKISEKERLADRKQARLDGYEATADQLAAMTERNQKELALLKEHDLAVKQTSLAEQSLDAETGILSKVTALKDFFVGKNVNNAASIKTPAQEAEEEKLEVEEKHHGEVIYELKQLASNVNKTFGITDLFVGFLKRMSLRALMYRMIYKPLESIKKLLYELIGREYNGPTADYGNVSDWGGGLFGRAKGYLHKGLSWADNFVTAGVGDGTGTIFGKMARGMAGMQSDANSGMGTWGVLKNAGKRGWSSLLESGAEDAAEGLASRVAGHFFGGMASGGLVPRTGIYGLSRGEFVVPRALARGLGGIRGRLSGLASSAMEENAVLGLNQTIRELVDSIKSSRFNKLGEYLKDIADNTRDTKNNLVSAISGGLGKAEDLADGVADSVKHFGGRSAGLMRKLFSDQDYRQEIVTRLKEISGNTAEAIKEKKNGFLDTIKKWLDGASTFLFTLLGGAGIGGLIASIMSWGETFSGIGDKLDDILVALGLKPEGEKPAPGSNTTRGFTAHRNDRIRAGARYGSYTLNKFLNRKGLEAGFKADRGFFGATAGDKYLKSQIDDVTGFFKGRFGTAEDMLNEGIRQEGKAARYTERAQELRQQAAGKRNFFGIFGEGASLNSEAELMERKATRAMENADDLLGRATSGDSTVSKAYGWVKTHISAAIDSVASSSAMEKIMSKTGLAKFVEFLKTALKSVTESAVAKQIGKITGFIGKVATAPASAVVFGIYDTFRGFKDAGELLGIRPEEVTYSMRTAVAAYEALINVPMVFGWTGVGAVPMLLDLLMSLAYGATGGAFNPKAYLLGKMVEIMDKVLFGKETNMSAKRDRFEQGFAKWQQTNGGDRDAYYAELDSERHEILDDLRNVFGGNDSTVAKTLFGEVDEEGKLSKHGYLSGLATNPLQTILGFGTGGLLGPGMTGAISNGRYIEGEGSDTAVGKFARNALAYVFGEADLKNGYKGQSNMFKRLYDGAGTFVDTLITDIETFQQRAIQTRKEQGDLMGTATVLFNMVRGLFGMEYSDTVLTESWNKLSTSVEELWDSGVNKVKSLISSLELFQQNSSRTLREQGPLLGSTTILFNAVRGMFGLEYSNTAIDDTWNSVTNAVSGLWTSAVNKIRYVDEQLDVFRQNAMDTVEAHGSFLGAVTIMFNCVRGIFGLEYDKDVVYNGWQSLTTTVGDMWDSAVEKIRYVDEQLDVFRENAMQTIDEQGSFLGATTIMFNCVRGIFGLDYDKDTLYDAYKSFAAYISSFYKSMQQRVGDFYKWMEDGLAYLRKTPIHVMIKDALKAIMFENKNATPPKPGEVDGIPELTDSGDVEGANIDGWGEYAKRRIAEGQKGSNTAKNYRIDPDTGEVTYVGTGGGGGNAKVPEGKGFNQFDPRWKNSKLPPNLMCGPTALASAMNSYGVDTDPKKATSYIENGDYATDGSKGLTKKYFEHAAKSMGGRYVEIDRNRLSLAKALNSGYNVIAGGVGKGFTPTGHYVTLSGFKMIDGEPMVMKNDPLSSRRGGYVPADTIINGSKSGPSTLGVVIPPGKGGGGNSMYMPAQEADECTRQAAAALYNAYMGTSDTADDWHGWYGNLVGWGAMEHAFSKDDQSSFESFVSSHFNRHPDYPLYLYQTGGEGHGAHPLNRGSGNHATVIGRRTTDGRYQVFDSNGGIIQTLSLEQLFDPTAEGSGAQGTSYDDSNLILEPTAAPTSTITDWGAENGESDGSITSGSEAGSSGGRRGGKSGSSKGGKSGGERKKRNLGFMDRIREGWGKMSEDIFKAYLQGKEYKGTDMSFLDWEQGSSGSSSSGAATGGAQFPVVNVGDTEKAVWGFLQDRGMKPAGIAGIMGNLAAESGMDPTRVEDSHAEEVGLSGHADIDRITWIKDLDDANQPGYGIAQWTYGSRQDYLNKKAEQMGKRVSDLGVQLNTLWDEGSQSGAIANADNAATPEEAAYNWMRDYERPDMSVAHTDYRENAARQYYDAYQSGQKPAGGGGLSYFFGDGLYGAGGGGLDANISSIDIGRMAEMARQQAEAMSEVLSAESKTMPFNTEDWKIGGVTQTALIDSIRAIDIHDEAHQMIAYLSMIAESIGNGGNVYQINEATVNEQKQKVERAKKDVLKEAFGNSNGKAARHRSNPTNVDKLVAIAKGSGFA